MNFAGVVFDPKLAEKVPTIFNTTCTNDSKLRFNYLTPKNDGSEVKLMNLNWLDYLIPEGELKDCKNDVENYVLKSFWAHQKDCPSVVDIKVRNTAKIMRKMLLNRQMHDVKAAQ